MSIIVLIYSILSVYNRFVCRHISAKFCQNSTDDGVAQSAKERITLTTLGSILSNETTTTTAMTTTTVSVLNLIENFEPVSNVRTDPDYFDYTVEEVNDLRLRKEFYVILTTTFA